MSRIHPLLLCSTGRDNLRKSDAECLSADPRICTLTPNGHLELGGCSSSRGSHSSERRSFPADSRKSSVMSLGKSSLERRSLSLVRHQTGFTPSTCSFCKPEIFILRNCFVTLQQQLAAVSGTANRMTHSIFLVGLHEQSWPDELMARALAPLHRSTSAFNSAGIILDPSYGSVSLFLCSHRQLSRISVSERAERCCLL